MYPEKLEIPVASPLSTPVATAPLRRNLTDAARESHIMIAGDATSARLLECRVLAEQSLAAGRTIIYISDNACGFGLASKYPVMRFSPDAHQTKITASDGAFFARQAIAGTSIAFNLQAFSNRDASRFLKDLLTALYTAETCPIDVFFENLDGYMGRKRHRGDRSTVEAFKSLLIRGPSSNGAGGNGARIVFTTKSPAEIPIESGNNCLTTILTRTCIPANINAIANYVSDRRLVANSHVAPWGISAMDDQHLFFWPFVDGKMHAPFYNAIPELETDAGDLPRKEFKTTGDERKVLDKLTKSKSDGKSGGTHASKSTTRVGSYSSERLAISRIESNIASNGSYVPNFKNTAGLDSIVTAAGEDRFAEPARWCHYARRTDLGNSIAINLAGYAYMQAVAIDEDAARSLFSSLLDQESAVSRKLAAQLAAAGVASLSDASLQVILGFARAACAADNTTTADFRPAAEPADESPTCIRKAA